MTARRVGGQYVEAEARGIAVRRGGAVVAVRVRQGEGEVSARGVAPEDHLGDRRVGDPEVDQDGGAVPGELGDGRGPGQPQHHDRRHGRREIQDAVDVVGRPPVVPVGYGAQDRDFGFFGEATTWAYRSAAASGRPSKYTRTPSRNGSAGPPVALVRELVRFASSTSAPGSSTEPARDPAWVSGDGMFRRLPSGRAPSGAPPGPPSWQMPPARG
ncbi:hypothetical protein ACU686_42260 [Yinghuangia aomiensis]